MEILSDFLPAFGSRPVAAGETGVWLWRSYPNAAALQELPGQDQARVSRLVSSQKQDALAASLVERRCLLSRLLDCDLHTLSIAHDEAGRPHLPDHPDTAISFSDSEGWNALALSRTGLIGIDLERLRELAWEPMLPMLASESEASLIQASVNGHGSTEPFFRCWTAKEAILKAAGTGLKGGAPRVSLPAVYINARSDAFELMHDGLSLEVETVMAGQVILTRAMQV